MMFRGFKEIYILINKVQCVIKSNSHISHIPKFKYSSIYNRISKSTARNSRSLFLLHRLLELSLGSLEGHVYRDLLVSFIARAINYGFIG